MRKAPGIAAVLMLMCGVPPPALAGPTYDNQPQLEPHSDTLTLRDRTSPVDSQWRPWVRIENVRLEPARRTEAAPAALLKFEVFNESSNRLTDVLLEVSILEAPRADHASARRRLVAGPFTIRGRAVLESGYTLNYEILLRNLSPHCDCFAKVDVLALRPLPEASASR